MSKNTGTIKFTAAPSAPFGDDDAAKYGPILMQIAEKLRVNEIRNIDKMRLYDIVAADKKHPLYGYVFNNTTSEAERQYRIDRCRKLIGGIRYVAVDAGRLNDLVKKTNARKLFVPADAPVISQGSGKKRKTNVCRPDLLKHEPSYVSAISRNIDQIRNALVQLEQLVADRSPPRGAARLASSLRAALDAYEAEIQDVAAE